MPKMQLIPKRKLDALNPQNLIGHIGRTTAKHTALDEQGDFGKVFKTAQNVGQSGGPAGIKIDSTELAGYSSGTTKEFYLQTSDGKAYAGGGNIILDSSHLTINNPADLELKGASTLILFDPNGDQIGYLDAGATDIVRLIASHSGNDTELRLKTYDSSGTDWGLKIQASSGSVRPWANDTHELGVAGVRWNHVWTTILGLSETTTPSALVNFGKLYTKNDNKLYFQDGAGTEHTVAYV